MPIYSKRNPSKIRLLWSPKAIDIEPSYVGLGMWPIPNLLHVGQDLSKKGELTHAWYVATVALRIEYIFS